METNGQRALHVASGEGEKRWVLGELITFKISGEDSAGAFALAEDVVPPQGGPPPHVIPHADVTFCVLEGELDFVVGERTLSASAGSVVYCPRGVLRGFRNVGTTPSRMFLIVTPGGVEKFFEEVGEPVTDPSSPPEGPPDLERLVAVARTYGIELPPPPG